MNFVYRQSFDGRTSFYESFSFNRHLLVVGFAPGPHILLNFFAFNRFAP
jgi:hypothetical protein